MFTKVIALFTTILTVIALPKEEVYTWCDPYETFCLFSYGSKLKVSNLTEAQEICTEINNKSWPVEITSQHVEDVLKQFLINISLPSSINVILNTVFQNNSWYWIENKSNFSSKTFCVEESTLSYGNVTKTSNVTYAVICSVECKAKWEHYNDSNVGGAQLYSEYRSYDECKNACETVQSYKCTAFDWNPDSQQHSGCWIHNNTNIANIIPANKTGVSHDIINRTSKTVDMCIKKFKDITSYTDIAHSTSYTEISINKSNPTSTKILLGILLPILFLIIVFLIIVGVILIRRKLQRSNSARKQSFAYLENDNDLNTDVPRNTFLNYVDINFKNEQQRQQQTNVNSRNNVGETNMSFVFTGEPKRYNGPGGEAYTEVDKTFEKFMTIH